MRIPPTPKAWTGWGIFPPPTTWDEAQKSSRPRHNPCSEREEMRCEKGDLKSEFVDRILTHEGRPQMEIILHVSK